MHKYSLQHHSMHALVRLWQTKITRETIDLVAGECNVDVRQTTQMQQQKVRIIVNKQTNNE